MVRWSAGRFRTVTAFGLALALVVGDVVRLSAAQPPEPDGFCAPAAPVPAGVFERRRAALLERLDSGVAVIRSGDRQPSHAHPQASDFRQDNDFYYMTGLETPGSWLVFFAPPDAGDSVVLFVPERDPAAEIWTGAQPDVEDVARRTGIETVHPAGEFEARVVEPLGTPQEFAEFRRLYLPTGAGEAEFRSLVDAAGEGRRSVSDLSATLAELRLVKDPVELQRLRRAIRITTEAIREAMRRTRPGMYEYGLEATIEYVFRACGAARVGFPSIVGSGPNGVVLHYDENRRRMEEGDLVVVDVGAEYDYYTADVTRTFPVDGRFTARQREVYELVLATQRAVIDSVRPGRTFRELTRIAHRYMREHSQGVCGDGGCNRHFLHGVGHWLGMDVHDVGDYATPFEPGMVLTIEPGIYLPEEALGVRIEDDVLVTPDGREVLSGDAPREVDEIEDLMAEGR